MRKRIPMLVGLGVVICVGFAIVMVVQAAPGGAPMKAPAGTAFTYQGVLKYNDDPADGLYDFEFYLYDDEVAGVQVGSTINLQEVTVSDGLFNVELDFGDHFDGVALWLEIRVRSGASTGEYQQLLPRQPLTAAPYALYASHVTWSGISGKPAGFADDTDNIDDTVSWGEVVGIVGNGSQQLAEGDHTHLKQTTIDLNVDVNGDIKVTDDPFTPDTDAYMGRVTKLFLKDLPDLLEELGGSGITIAQVNQNVKILWLTVETYAEPERLHFRGYRWAQVTGDPAGSDENDIYWPVRVDEYNNGSTEDTSATYKLFMVNGFLY